MKIEISEIMQMIPHRYPFLLIDRVDQLFLNQSIIGIKNITFNEPQFMGHFPHKPIMPGVLIIEAMAQLSGILIAKSIATTKDKDVLFMSIEETKFRKIVQPGDTLRIHSTIRQNRANVWKFFSYVKVEDQIVAESNFTAMVQDRQS